MASYRPSLPVMVLSVPVAVPVAVETVLATGVADGCAEVLGVTGRLTGGKLTPRLVLSAAATVELVELELEPAGLTSRVEDDEDVAGMTPAFWPDCMAS